MRIFIVIITAMLVTGCKVSTIKEVSYTAKVNPTYSKKLDSKITLLANEEASEKYLNNVKAALQQIGFQSVMTEQEAAKDNVKPDIVVVVKTGKNLSPGGGVNARATTSTTTTTKTGANITTTGPDRSDNSPGAGGFAVKRNNHEFTTFWYDTQTTDLLMEVSMQSKTPRYCEDSEVYGYLLSELFERVDFTPVSKQRSKVNYQCQTVL